MSAPAERLKMSEAWRQWEGEIVDERFLLHRFLGSSDHSAVFLTEIGQPPRKAALKFIEATADGSRAQLSRWEKASKLSHAHLIRILDFGGCRLGRASMLYVVSEFAEENLSQILPVRAISPAEAEYMLRSVIEAFAYLHGQGLVHGHLKPSNVMAVEEKLKISSDGVCRAKEKLPNSVRTIYDPPEATTSGPSPAGDVWSLGLTLVEALTQKPSLGEGLRQGDPLLPETVPPPFGEIARQCLRLDPQRRLTVSDIAARLLPTAPPPQKSVASRYGIPSAVLAVILGGVIVVQRVLTKGPESRSPQEQLSQPATQAPSGGSENKSPSDEQHAAIAAVQAPATPPGTAQGKAPNASPRPTNEASVSSPKSKNEPPASPVVEPAPKRPPNTRAASTPGEVKERFLPPVPHRSLNTINGHVRVTVKVDVDSSGKVTRAHLESPGPSHYFAKLAQDSATHWKFTPPQQNGRAVLSQWFLRYTFGRSGTEVHPTQVAPRQ